MNRRWWRGGGQGVGVALPLDSKATRGNAYDVWEIDACVERNGGSERSRFH